MPTTKTYQEFSSSIKAKYPQYKDIDDLELAQKMVAKYPEYKDVVQFETPKAAPTANVAPNTSLTDMDKLRLGSFPAAPMNLSLQDKPAGQFLPPAKAVQPQIYNPAQRTEDMATLYNKEVENAEAPNIRKEFIQAGESVNKGRGTAVVATEKSNEYLSNTENIADTQYDQMMTNPATYTDDNTNAIFDAMSPQKQYEEWQKNPEKWNDRPFIQNMMSTGQKETGFWGSGAGDIVQALNAGGAAVGGGLSEFMHQNIEKPLYGWMAEPNSRMIWGRIADYFFDEQEASSGAAGKENILDENGQVRQKDFVDYFKEGDYTGGFANLGIGALESAPTSAVAIGASAMGQPSVGLAVIGAQVTGTRKRELDKNNPELSEFQKNIIAYTSGAIEAGSEMLGDVPIGKMLGKIYKTGGSAVANQVMSNSVESIIKNTTKQMRNASILWKAPLSEGGEEFASGVGNYLLDSAMGIQKFNFNEMMTESGKQAVYGAVAGGGFGLVGAPGLIRNTKVASKLEGLKTEYDKANSNIQAAFADSEFEFDGEKIITLPLNQQAEILASVLQAENLTSEQKDAIQQYMQAGNGLNTALVNVGLTNIELLRKKANAVKQIENQTNEKTGTVDNITIQGSAENENYNLKSGTIILDENGKVNPQESDEAIYYFTGATNEDGTPEVNIITPENINAIQSADPKQLLQQSFMDIEAEEFIRSEFGAGMDVMLNTDMGEMPGTIVAVVPEGLVVNVQGTETIIPFKQAVQDVQVDATKEEIKAAKKTIKDFAKYTKKQYGYEKFKTDPETFISERIELLEYWNVSNQNIINNNEDEDNYDGTNKTLYEYYKKQIADNNSEIAALKEVQKSYDIVGGRKSAKKSVETKQQPTQEQPAELATRQSQVPATTYAPGTSIVVNGTTFVVGEQDENGNYAINDENGQSLDRFTPQEMADFGFSNVAVRPTQAEEQPLITEGEQETAPVTSETTPATPEAAPVQQYPITKNGEIDFDAMTVAQTYQYMVDNYGQNEANSGLSLQEKSIQGLISQNIKALDKVNASLYAQIKGAKSIQEQLKIREKNKAAITKLTAERTELDAQLAEIRSLMPKAEQTPTQPEVTATASSNVRPEEQLRREQEAERLTAEQAKVDSTEQTLTPNVDTSEQTLTPEAEQQPVIEVREKKKWTGTPQWTRRINNLGDPITLEDVVLRRVAGGAKFVWSADAPHKGLSQELGFTNNPGEREARKSMIDEKNGMTPQELAHDIYESSELQFMGEVDYQDIYNAVVDTLLQVNSATAALERAEANRNKYDMMQEDYGVYTTFTQNEIDYLEQIPDEILAGYLGITNFTPEQIDFIFNIQNEYYANEQQQTPANAEPAYTSTSERSESIKSTTSAGTDKIEPTAEILAISEKLVNKQPLTPEEQSVYENADNKRMFNEAVGRIIVRKISEDEIKQQSKKKGKKAKPEATTPQAQIQQVLDNYDNSVNMTMNDVINDIISVAYDNDIAAIQESYKTYEAELREDREQFGERGDREAIENNFMKVVEQYMNGDQLPDVGNMIEKPVEARQAPKYKNGDTVYYQGKQYVVNSIYNDALAYDLETADGKPAFEEIEESNLTSEAPAPRSILDVAVEQVKKNEEKAAQQPKEVDVAGVFNSLNKKGTAKLSENIVPNKVSAAQAEADAALQDFLDAFNDLNSDNLGIVDNTAEKQAKMLVAGTKMVGAYTKLGLYKFADIMYQLGEKGIQITDDLLSAIKKAYGAFAAESEIDELDDMKTVRSFTLNDLQQKKNEDLTPKTDNLPKNDVSLTDQKFIKDHIIFGTIPKTNDNGQPRSTEIIESEAAAIESTSAAITNSASNVGSDKQRAGQVKEQATEQIKSVESLLAEVDNKLANLRLTDKSYSTDGIAADYPINVLAKGEIKKDLTKYIKAVAEITGLAHDTDKKGKTEIVNVNIAPAGGDATFFLWSKTNPEHGVYVSIPYDPDMNSGGWYDNYKVLEDGWRATILWRVVNRAKKYDGSNQYMPTNVTAQEMAETLLKGINAELKSKGLAEEQVQDTKQNAGLKITKTTNDNGNSKQRVLQGSNKRLSGTASPSLFDGMDDGGIGNNVGRQSEPISGTNGEQQQPAGRTGNVLPRNAELSDTSGRGRIGSREEVGTNAQGTERTGGTGVLDTPALVPFNAEDNDTQSFNQSRKYDDNIAAIETLITLVKENRKATPDEKTILSNYVGFGGLKDIVLNPESAEGWKESSLKYRAQVKRIVELATEFDQVTGSTDSLAKIKGSILNAHFTSSSIIRSVYDGVQKLGFKGGRMLEPSAGIGNFVTYAPERIKANSSITAVELDNLTGNILKYLHDDVNVKVSGIQDAQIPNNSQDLVISNVPFGNYKIFDKAFKGDKAEFQNRIHNYFFAKAVDMAREGGIIAFVTSKGVMDAQGNEALRKYLNDNTEFLGAVRLPNNAFKNNANTEVVTDIIFLKKNTTGTKSNPDFVSIKQVEATHKDGEKQMVNVNNYFVENPQNMLGNIVAGGLYSREDYTVENKTGYDLSKAIKNALPAGVYEKVNSKIGLQANDTQQTIDAIKEGNIEVTGGRVVRKEEGQLTDISINEPQGKIEHYIRLRNALMNLIYSEYLGKPDSELNAVRQQLNTEYDTFVKKHGKLSKNAIKIAKQDADGFNVLSLEVADKKDGKADIFRQRTIQPIQNKLTAESVDEAIVISLYENASIDVERIAELLNKTVPEVLQQAKGKIFEQPEGGFVTREEYLSGNVKAKLRQAQEAVDKGFTEFSYNVEQLMDVIPADIPAMHIEARLGSRWIPQEVYTEFAQYLFNTPNAKIIYQRSIDAYSNNGRLDTVEAQSKWGTARRNGTDILLDALHINPAKIYDTYRENGQDVRVLNVDETKKAVEKYEDIRKEFEAWVYKAEERRTLLARIYNEKYNTTIKRSYNGDHLNIAGINGVTLRAHQKDAIWMLLQNNGGIIDHLVGAGKTFIMVAGTMEMKRTGIAKKPMIMALKSTIPQIIETYRQAYPMAKILAPLEKDFTKDNRKKLFSQIANNEWDVIIMSHENYGKIPHEADIQRKFVEDEMREIEEERAELEAQGEKQALKGLEIRLKNLEARLQKISDIGHDNTLTFEQMGIDHIMVDESQQFKNLSYVTKQRGVAGLSKAEGSKRAFNLFIGIRYLQQKYGEDKGTTFLSGTPISNSMVEMYLLLKYLRPTKMAELGFNSFDAWATTFASPNSDIEMTVTGDIKAKTRFREFINVPELSMLYTEIADIRTDANTPLDKPKMKGGGYTVVDIKMSEDQVEYGQRLMEFARTKDGHHIGMSLTKNQETAAMLLATNLSSKMAIDMRLIDPSYSYDPNGKIGKLVDNVERIYNETAEYKGTQLIFSDLGTPKNKANKTATLRDYMEDEMGTNLDTLNEIFGNPDEAGYKYPSMTVIRERLTNILELTSAEIDGIITESENAEEAFNVYAEVKKRLVEKGVPEEQVVFIHDYNSQKAKQKLFDAVNAGQIRIVLGSTQKLGTGVNVQERVVAVHHLDVPWTPASMEQRNGRAIRQGNWVAKKHLNNELPIYAYATERTLDAYKYQLLQTKQRFLDQVKSGDVEERTVRESDGDSESGVGYAELVAMLSGNKDILLKSKLEQQVQNLTRSKRNFLSEVYEAQDRVQKSKERIPIIESNIAKTTENVETIANAVQYAEDGKMIVADINGETLIVKNDKGKVVPTERVDYGKRAVEIAKAKLDGASFGNIVKIFSQNGFDFYGSKRIESAMNNGKFGEVEKRYIVLRSKNGVEYNVTYSETPGILLNNIQKAIQGIPDILTTQRAILDKANKDVKAYQEIIDKGTEWEKEPELTKALNELKEVTKRLDDLSNDNQPKPPTDGEPVTDDKIRIGDLTFTIGKESFVTMAEAKNKAGGDVAVVRINTQLSNQDYTRRVKPTIGNYFGEWNSSNKVIMFNDVRQALNFKTTIENEFKNEDLNYEAPQFQAISPIGFYSTVEKALEAINQERGTRDQFRAMLLKNGAKQAEMDWMGFYELPEKLTKADIQNWIDENRIEVEEVEKGANEATWKENNGVHTLGEFTIKLNKANWKWGVFNDEGWHGDYFDLDAAKNFAEANTPEFDNTKFSQYVLPGGENYKELLLSMPTTHYMYDINKVKIEETNTFWKFYDKDGELITGYAKEHNPTKEDVISTFKSNFKIENKDQFKSSHFDEANILAHIRFNERTVNGERVLFIEEFQSDWAQKGKKEGFKIENTDEQIEIKFKERGFSTEKEGEHYTWIINPNGKRTGDVNNKDLAQTKRDIIEGFEQGIVPVMPFKKTDQWVNLAARRMMRYAAENGFDRIAWTNGEQQADRYDLSKQIDEISYHQSGTRYYTNITYAKAGPQNGRAENIELKEDELENYFGKEIAQKMANNEGVDSQAYEQNNGTKLQTKTLSGLDLKVGGSGMKAFYDAIVPSAMSKLGKPFGAKVENIGLKQDTTKGEVVKDELTGKYDVNLNGEIIGKDFLNYSEANRFAESNKKTNYSTQQSIPVTDSMKETAMAGLPLYHTGTTMKRTSKKEVAAMVEQLLKTGLTSEVRMVTPEEIAAVDRKAAKMLETKSGTIYGFVKNGVVYLNSTTPNLNTPIHEFGHLWIDAIEGSELYNRGAELVKNTPYWERVNADPNYSSLSEAARIKEAMAQAIGDKGEAVKRDLGLFARIKVWIADVWTRIGAKFGIQNLTPEQIQNLTFSDFVDVAVSELLSGKYLAERNKNTNFETSNNNNGSNEKTRLDNGRTVESSSFDKLVGRSETGRRIYKTIKASNNAGSTSTILTVEEREELESRGINPDFDKNIFREVLTKNASENGVLLDKSYLDDKILIHDKKANNTAENDVYLNKDKTTITKVNDLTYVFGIENHNNLSGTIDRLLSHNSLFPNVAYTIKGFIINKEGKISLVMEQPLVEAERNATRQEIEEYLTDKGFKLDGTRIWSNYSDVWSNGEYDIYDARPANVLKGKDGKLYFIDTFPHSVQYTKNLPPAKPTFKGDLGEYAFQVVQHNEEAAERTTRISKMQRLQEIMVAKSALAARHRNKEVSNQEYAKQMLALHEEKQRVMKGLPEPEPTDEDPDDNDPKPIRIIGQSVTEWATQVADWNYRQTIARALAKTASSVTGGLPPVDDDTDISGDMIRAELDQRLGGWFGRLAEAHQDNIRSVRIFQDMLKEKGTRISDFNNFYMQYTAIQGKNDAHLKDFGKRFMEAINANVLNIQKYTNYEYRDLENYVFLKHGIERNEYMRQAAAEEAVNEKLPKLTQEQIDGDIDGSLQDEYKAAYDQFLEEETAKVANKDYSGLFAVAAEIWAKQNGEAFNPKKKGDVARIQKMDEFKAERDAVIVEYIAKFEKTISETIIPTAVKGEQLTVSGFWAAINAATNYSLDRLVGSGIESKEEIDDLKARYQYYVPMRGHEVEAEKIWQYEAPDNKNVVSKAIMQASGRGSRAEHPFAYIIQMAQTSINKANRNQLNQTILRLARQDKSGLMSVSETWYLLTGTDPETGKEIWTESEPVYTDDHEYRASEVRAWNEKMTKLEGEGKARKFKKGLRIGGLFIKPKQKRQHAITVFEDGVAYQVYINGNPRVSQAINELNDKQTEIPIIPQLTRFCASMMTSRSPQFMLTNGARDLAFASTILPSKEGARYTGQFLKNYPVAMAVLANNATFDFGNNKAQYKKYLKEFEMNGGETGYSHLLELQDIQKELFKQQKGKNYLNPKTDIDAILSVIDAGNKVIENSTRLSVYITSRENGRSIERSVSDSKEVTLNFNRRGSGAMGASFIKSFFMFVNAGVQALANFGHVYKMHPIRMSATISSYAAVGFIMPMIISMIGGDDDEKEYMNMTDWERQTNLCLPTGSGFAKIPLPQEMRVFFKLGDEVYKLYSGRTEASETAIATLKSAADMIPISPLGTIASGEINDFGDLMKTLSPDAFRSIAELSANTNFMGGQIYDKYKAEKDDLPGYQKARLNRVGEARAPESIVGFTKWLDHLTGGNDVEKGGVSWNPDIVNHLAKSYLGGMYSLVAEGGKSFTKRFYTSNADIEEKNTTVKDYYKRTREADELIRQEKGYWEQWQDGTITEAQYNAAVNQKAVDKAYEIHEYDKAITRIERILKTGELMPDDELYYKHTSDSLKKEVIRIKLK